MGNLLWIDLEMSGLDEKVHHILEVAAVVTDANLKHLSEYHCVVYQPQRVLDLMDDWCTKTHGASGLTKAVTEKGRKLAEVETELLAFLKPSFSPNEKIILCGNSIGQDRRFIDAYMKKLAARLHYRIVDVSSFKEVFSLKWQEVFKKKNSHRAVEDIHESIRELEHYLSFVKIEPKEGKANADKS